MSKGFYQVAFTPSVQALQERYGSRRAYARQAERGGGDALGPEEREFIESRDSFYLATVNETGWPYIQHRGGPKGFLKVIDDRTIGFVDLEGNKQYVSLGNLSTNDRAALFLMDYPSQSRLKILAHAKVIERDGHREFIFSVEGFDWNCPQHITPRYTQAEIEALAGT
jgi:predicted pyridoxine 5'-phosphate oxidase superfamily flavin-nucleotide-binding protein